MAATAHILRLPAELLEMIADECDGAVDISNLRLTCKALDAAAFKSFSADYISDLTCFMLDPSRLLRVDNIVSTPHLATKVRTVKLTLLLYETLARNIPVVPKADETMSAAHDRCVTAYTEQQYELLECPTNSIPSATWIRLEKVLAKLGKLPRSSIIIDFQGEDCVYDRIAGARFELLVELLRLAQNTSCNVSGIRTSGAYAHHPARFKPKGEFHELVKNLDAFGYWHLPMANIELVDDKAKEDYEFVKTVTQAAQLKDFCLLIDDNAMATYDGPTIAEVARDLLSAGNFSFLERLELGPITVSWQVLSALLLKCRNSLKEIYMNQIFLAGDGSPWDELFHALEQSPALRKLWCHYPTLDNPEEDNFWAVSFLMPDDPEQLHRSAMPTMELIDAQPFLSLNTKKGLVYEEQV